MRQSWSLKDKGVLVLAYFEEIDYKNKDFLKLLKDYIILSKYGYNLGPISVRQVDNPESWQKRWQNYFSVLTPEKNVTILLASLNSNQVKNKTLMGLLEETGFRLLTEPRVNYNDAYRNKILLFGVEIIKKKTPELKEILGRVENDYLFCTRT